MEGGREEVFLVKGRRGRGWKLDEKRGGGGRERAEKESDEVETKGRLEALAFLLCNLWIRVLRF